MKKFIYRGAALLCLPVGAMAQTGAHEPTVSVPAVLYRSVFVDAPKGVETGSLDWRAANTEVGKNHRGHIDILKWEAAQAKARAAQGAVPPRAPGEPEVAKP